MYSSNNTKLKTQLCKEVRCQTYFTRNDKLNGKDDDVTLISPPSDTRSRSFLSKFGRVSSSS